MATELPVVVAVERPDGTQEWVRVGTARRSGGQFLLDLGLLRVNPVEPPARSPPPSSPPPRPGSPPVGGTQEDLEFIAARARRTLADPSKARWHAQEREILAQVERELARFHKDE